MDEGKTLTGMGPLSRPPAPVGEFQFVAEPGPGFIPADMHRDDLARKRDEATIAADFHRRKLAEAEAVVVSCDSALGALREQFGEVQPVRGEVPRH